MWPYGYEWSPFYVWSHIDWFARAVTVVVMAMLMSAIVVLVERMARYGEARRQSSSVEPLIASALRDGHLDEAIAMACRNPKSPAASVVAAALIAFQSNPRECSTADAIAVTARAARRRRALLNSRLRAGVGTLSTTAYLVPFFGLVATVSGVWSGIACICGQVDSARAAAAESIAMALLPTGMGLAVAIVATWFHRYLESRLEEFDTEMKAASLEVVNRLTALPNAVHSRHDSGRNNGWIEDGQVERWEVGYDRQRLLLAAVWAFVLYALFLVAAGLYWHVAH